MGEENPPSGGGGGALVGGRHYLVPQSPQALMQLPPFPNMSIVQYYKTYKQDLLSKCTVNWYTRYVIVPCCINIDYLIFQDI